MLTVNTRVILSNCVTALPKASAVALIFQASRVFVAYFPYFEKIKVGL
jgi:hypothetical protein